MIMKGFKQKPEFNMTARYVFLVFTIVYTGPFASYVQGMDQRPDARPLDQRPEERRGQRLDRVALPQGAALPELAVVDISSGDDGEPEALSTLEGRLQMLMRIYRISWPATATLDDRLLGILHWWAALVERERSSIGYSLVRDIALAIGFGGGEDVQALCMYVYRLAAFPPTMDREQLARLFEAFAQARTRKTLPTS